MQSKLALLGLVVVCFTPPAAQGDGFVYSNGVYTIFNVPQSSSNSDISVGGINNAGVVVGNSLVGPYVYSGGTVTMLNITDPSGGEIVPMGINDADQIVGHVGYTGNAVPLTVGFLSDGTNLTKFSASPYETYVNGINDLGQVVGISCAAPSGSVSGPCQGFLDTNGHFKTISDPAATNGTFPYGINNAGQIVGIYGTASGNSGFLDTGGVFTTINFPGATTTYAYGINSLGQIVGVDCFQFGPCGGYLDTNGVFTTIDVPGASDTRPQGINDEGQIVGEVSFPSPVAEPGTLGLVGLGLAAIWRRLRNQRES